MAEYLVETHMHTREVSPCGKVGARDGVRIYKELGYDAVVITDHFTTDYFEMLGGIPWREKTDRYLEGYRLAREEGAAVGMRVLLGMEFCVPGAGDDILAYGFDEQFLYDHEDLYRAKPEELGKVAAANGLLLLQAHPFRHYITKRYDEVVEGMEVFNGNPRHDSDNDRATAYAAARNMITVSGSDFHQRQDAGNGGIYLPLLPADSMEFAELIRRIRTPRLVLKSETKEPGAAV